MLSKRLIKSNDAGGGQVCRNIVDDYKPFSGGIALYQLNGNANDVSGNYNGTASNVTYGTGKFGQAGVFNGSATITLSGLNTFFTPKVNTSVSLWVKGSGGLGYIFSDEVFSFTNNYNLTISQGASGVLALYSAYGGTANSFLTTETYNDNNWHHIVAVINQSTNTGSLYVDGSFKGSYTLPAPAKVGTPYTVIGTVGNNYYPYNGSIDQVRIFDRALNPTEVSELYAEQVCYATCASDEPDVFQDGSGVALYQLNWDGSDKGGQYDGVATDVSFVNGKIDSAGSFNGSSSYIPTGLDNFFNQKRNCTVSLWFKAGSLSNANGYLFIDYSGYNNCGIKIKSNGTIGVDTFYGSGARDTVTTGTYNDDNWHHIAVSIDTAANTRKTYVDTVLVLNDTLPSGTFSVTAGFFAGFGVLGNPNPISQYYFKGNIDQARIFNKPLSASEVTTLYNEVACEKTCTTDDNQLVPNCIAYYKLDGNANDALNTYDGTPTNVSWTQGRLGSAGGFNGSSTSWIGVNNLVGSISDNQPLSVSLWFKPNGSQVSCLFEFGNFIDGCFRAFILSDNTISFQTGTNNSTDLNIISTDNYSPNNWNHISCVYNGTTMFLYLNNEFQGQLNNSYDIDTVRGFIGSSKSGSQANFYNFNGSIDQVRIYDRAITATEVETLYNEVACPSGASFNTVLYTGNGGTQNVGGVGFQPDLVWAKARSASGYWHVIADKVRGVNNTLASNETAAERTGGRITSFDSDGFGVNVTPDVSSNASGVDYVAWCWKAGGDAVTNTDGTITSEVSANVDAGFSIVSWTSNYSGNINGSVGHGLNQSPDLYIVKKRNNTSQWYVYAQGAIGNNTLLLNSASAATSAGWVSAPTSTTFNAWDWSSGSEMITYCFHSVAGFSKFGSYTGTGSAGNAQTLGFEPAFVLAKRTDNASGWLIVDNKRNGTANYELFAHSSSAEYAYDRFLFNANGFEFNSSAFNESGSTWIYMAFANQF